MSDGKAASQETTNFLLTCKQIRSNSREKIIKECTADSKRFKKNYPRRRSAYLQIKG